MRESLKTMENGNYIHNYIHIYIQKEAVFHFQERSIAVHSTFGLFLNYVWLPVHYCTNTRFLQLHTGNTN